MYQDYFINHSMVKMQAGILCDSFFTELNLLFRVGPNVPLFKERSYEPMGRAIHHIMSYFVSKNQIKAQKLWPS